MARLTPEQMQQLPERIRKLLEVCNAVADTIAEVPEGVPGRVLYAGLMTQGCTLDQFEILMQLLIDSDRVEKRGQLYFTKKAA